MVHLYNAQAKEINRNKRIRKNRYWKRFLGCLWVKWKERVFSCQLDVSTSDKYAFDSGQYDDSQKEIIDITQTRYRIWKGIQVKRWFF